MREAGIGEDLKRFLRMHSDIRQHNEQKDKSCDAQDGIRGCLPSRMKACEPGRHQIIPARRERKPRDAGKYVASSSNQTKLKQKNCSNREQIAYPRIAESNANRLRNRGNEIDVARLGKSDHRAGSKD